MYNIVSKEVRKKIHLLFEIPKVKEQVDFVFNEMNDEIRLRFNEIMNFIEEHNTNISDEIKFKEVLYIFKTNFFKYIFNEAIKILPLDYGNNELIECIISLITKENLKKAILGKPMVYAFSKSIHNIPTNDALTNCLYNGFVILLEKKFLKDFPNLY